MVPDVTDRRASVLCAIHLIPFAACSCPERRDVDRPLQLVACDVCGRHFTLCECERPELTARGAA